MIDPNILVSIGVALGLVDDAINFALQIVRGIPSLYLLTALSVIFRPEPLELALIFGVLGWTGICRQIRGLVFSVKQCDYVDVARVIGVPVRGILVRHLLPNVSSIILVLVPFDIGGAIIGESGLSFLGLGIQPPTASWGNMLSDALDNITQTCPSGFRCGSSGAPARK